MIANPVQPLARICGIRCVGFGHEEKICKFLKVSELEPQGGSHTRPEIRVCTEIGVNIALLGI